LLRFERLKCFPCCRRYFLILIADEKFEEPTLLGATQAKLATGGHEPKVAVNFAAPEKVEKRSPYSCFSHCVLMLGSGVRGVKRSNGIANERREAVERRLREHPDRGKASGPGAADEFHPFECDSADCKYRQSNAATCVGQRFGPRNRSPRLRARLEDGSKDQIVEGSVSCCIDGLVCSVHRTSDHVSSRRNRADTGSRHALTTQVDTVRASFECDIDTFVHENSRTRSFHDCSGLLNERQQKATFQMRLPKLNQMNAGPCGSSYPIDKGLRAGRL
jgi:hypothetical protein